MTHEELIEGPAPRSPYSKVKTWCGRIVPAKFTKQAVGEWVTCPDCIKERERHDKLEIA